jgi:hypothetical protein
MIAGATDLFMTYSILRRLTKSFEDWQAFKLGVIDKDGNILIPKDKRTLSQEESLRTFDVVVLNMKKMLAKLPGGNSKFATYSAALFLLKEPKPLNEEEMIVKFKEFLLSEDAPANAIGSGHIAGTNPDDSFAGHKVFNVDGEKVWKSRNGKHPKHKYKKYVGEDETGEEIRKYGRENPKKGILLRNSKSGEMVFLRRAKQQ